MSMHDEHNIEVMIGVDAHRRTHTLVAADELGRHMADGGGDDRGTHRGWRRADAARERE
jgi:hypothetical protein